MSATYQSEHKTGVFLLVNLDRSVAKMIIRSQSHLVIGSLKHYA